MRYAMLGQTGLLVSRLAFGAMTFTAGNKDVGAISKDTADGYAGGESETLLGRALQSRRDSVVIATKVGFRTGPALTQAGLSRVYPNWFVDQPVSQALAVTGGPLEGTDAA